MFPNKVYVLFGGLAISLVGCGSGSGSETGGQVDYSHLELMTPAAEPLTNQHDESVFANYLKNGLRLQVAGTSVRPTVMLDSVAEGALDSASAPADGFSDTNVHVAGVDEADRVKYDGEHLFVLSTPQMYYPETRPAVEPASAAREPAAQGIRILRTHPELAQASEVAEILLHESSENRHLSQLYLQDNEQGETQSLIAISATYEPTPWLDQPVMDTAPALSTTYWPTRGGTRLDVFDVSTIDSPRPSWTLEVDGQLLNSRKVDSILYLVTRHYPHLEGMIRQPTSSSDSQGNERLIAQAPVSQLLPRFQIDEGEPKALVHESDCFLPKSVRPNEGHADILAISAFDMHSGERVSSVCLNTHVSGLYASPTSLYLGTSVDGKSTGVHKFSLDQGHIDYRGTGKVRGTLNWAAPSFSMDEQDGYLRIVTTDHTGWQDRRAELHHELNVFRSRDDSDELERVATLPNNEQPDAIGKPGEDIYAVRFLGDRGYIVTFERIDPLYVLDLSDHHNPRIAGELEVPGFSTYLHPVGGGYLASVGQNADANGMPTEVKIELFDVRDMASPQSVGVHLVGTRGSWSQALQDLQAFTFLPVGDDQFRFTVPVDSWNPGAWRENRLYLYEINGLSGAQAQLDAVGSLLTETDDAWPSYGTSRARLHGGTVFYIHDNRVWSSFWESPELVNGPY